MERSVIDFRNDGALGGSAAYWEMRDYEDGGVVFREGDTADFMGVVVEGRARIELESGEVDSDAVLARVARGEVVGELALLDGGVRSATVVAEGPLRLRVLTAVALERLAVEDPVVAVEVFRGLGAAAAAKVRMANERMAAVMCDALDGLPRPIPVFLKIAPDLTAAELSEIADVARAAGVDAIIATNTTLDRDGLQSGHRAEKGGLSGAPLFEKSTRVLAQLSQLTDGAIPLIGVGGISSAEQAYQKIRAGASAVQLYTALVYHGLSLVPKIARGLDDLLARDGFASVADAVGTGRADWL